MRNVNILDETAVYQEGSNTLIRKIRRIWLIVSLRAGYSLKCQQRTSNVSVAVHLPVEQTPTEYALNMRYNGDLAQFEK